MWTDICTYYLHKKSHILCTFKDINDCFYLIFQNYCGLMENRKIITYDFIKDQIINEIKGIFYDDIKHFLDRLNKRDLILISQTRNTLQIWNFKNWECIIELKDINNNIGALYSSCIINDKNNNYIITSCLNWSNNSSEPIKIYNFEGKFIKELNESKLAVLHLDTFFDSKLSKNFIIACSRGCIKAYDYNENKLYKIFSDGVVEESDGNRYIDFCIRENNEITELISSISSTYNGKINIWDFHKGELINKIKIKTKEISGIFLWQNKYLYVGCDNLLKKVDLKDNTYIEIEGHVKIPLSISLINHPKYGEFLISGGFDDIIIWKNNNSKFEIQKMIYRPPSVGGIKIHSKNPSAGFLA